MPVEWAFANPVTRSPLQLRAGHGQQFCSTFVRRGRVRRGRASLRRERVGGKGGRDVIRCEFPEPGRRLETVVQLEKEEQVGVEGGGVEGVEVVKLEQADEANEEDLGRASPGGLVEWLVGRSSTGKLVRSVGFIGLATAVFGLFLGKEGVDSVVDGFVNGPHLAVAAAVGASAFVQALAGFGFAIVAVSALSQIEWIANSSVFNDIQPVAALFSTMIGWYLVFPELRKIKWKELTPLLVATTLFTPVGALVVGALHKSTTLKVLGSLIVGYVGYASLGIQLPKALGGNFGSWSLGALAGMFGGAFDIQGPPLVLHGDAAEWDCGNGEFRRNMLAILSVNSSIVILYDLLSGRLEDYYVRDFFGHSVPFVLLGIGLGKYLSERMDATVFKKVVLGICAIMGTRLLLS